MASEHDNPVRRRQTDDLIATANQLGLVDELNDDHWVAVNSMVLAAERRQAFAFLAEIVGPPVAEGTDE